MLEDSDTGKNMIEAIVKKLNMPKHQAYSVVRNARLGDDVCRSVIKGCFGNYDWMTD